MPVFEIVTDNITKHLGTFDSKEDILKLRFFKDRPALAQYIREVIPQPYPAVKRSTRWRIIWDDSYTDLLGSYSELEVYKLIGDTVKEAATKIVRVPRYAYHESDDATS